MTNLRKAATAVLVRDSEQGLEVLLLERSSHGFFAKMWVFPGGSLDAEDLEQGAHELEAAQIAAARETMEEAGIDLNYTDLLPFAHWTPPEGLATRFATWFFISDDGGEQVVSIDDHEIVGYAWFKPSQALAMHREGNLPMAPPTVVTLTELSHFSNCAAALDFYKERGIFHYLPKVGHKQGKEFLMLYNGDVGYGSGDPDVSGHRNRVLMKDGICHYETDLL